MKNKYFIFSACACLFCLAIGMVVGTLIERRHLNFWYPVEEREQIQADIEKLKEMLAEIQEIKQAMDNFNREAEKLTLWNHMIIKPRPSDED